jgi:hypothetical protein
VPRPVALTPFGAEVLVGTKSIRLPVLPRSGPVYKTGAYAARPSRSAVWRRTVRHVNFKKVFFKIGDSLKISVTVIVGILWLTGLQIGSADTPSPEDHVNHLQMFQEHPEQFKDLLASKVPSVKAAAMMGWSNKIGAYSSGREISPAGFAPATGRLEDASSARPKRRGLAIFLVPEVNSLMCCHGGPDETCTR